MEDISSLREEERLWRKSSKFEYTPESQISSQMEDFPDNEMQDIHIQTGIMSKQANQMEFP